MGCSYHFRSVIILAILGLGNESFDDILRSSDVMDGINRSLRSSPGLAHVNRSSRISSLLEEET